MPSGLAPLRMEDIVVSHPIPVNELAPHEMGQKRHAAILRAANVLQESSNYTKGTISVRSTLPFNDLALDGRGLTATGADSRDQWVLPALTQATTLAWINVAVPINRVVVVYGCFYRTGNPRVAVLRLEGGAAVKYEYQIENFEANLEWVHFFPELATWKPQEQLIARIVPRDTVALGEQFGLLAVTAEGKGQRVGGDFSITAG